MAAESTGGEVTLMRSSLPSGSPISLTEARGWSFTYLSVHSGLAKNTIVEVESGRTEPRLNTIAALAGSFGKTLSELLRGL